MVNVCSAYRQRLKDSLGVWACNAAKKLAGQRHQARQPAIHLLRHFRVNGDRGPFAQPGEVVPQSLVSGATLEFGFNHRSQLLKSRNFLRPAVDQKKHVNAAIRLNWPGVFTGLQPG
jgi:hypothetical protein